MSSGLSPELVMRLIEDGQTQSGITREFGVSRQYVSKLAREGGHINKYRIVTENMPWRVDPAFGDNTIYKNLRRHCFGMAYGFDALGEADRVHLRGLHRKVTNFNVVVDYDPSYPPKPGITSTPGFDYRPRTEQDENFIIKLRPDLNLTSEGAKLWRLPAEVI